MKLTRISLALLVLTCSFLTVPVLAFGQSAEWSRIKATPTGTDIIIERKKDRRVVGYVQAVTDDSIAVRSEKGSFIIGKDNITKVFLARPRNKRKSLNRGALYGMLTGLAIGLAISLVHEPEGQEMPGMGTFLAGAGIGLWAGNRHGKGKDKGELIYSAK